MQPAAEGFLLENGIYVPFIRRNGRVCPQAWMPLAGSQCAFLAATEKVVLYEGGRGLGKSLLLLADFCQNIHYGPEHKGIIFRQSHPQLSDIISLSRIWLPRMFPQATFNQQSSTWEFPGGARLTFSHFPDANFYTTDQLGKSWTYVAFDEGANWPDVSCFKLMLGNLRSTVPNFPLHLRIATNPYGKCRDSMMEWFKIPLPHGPMVGPLISADDTGPARRVIHGDIRENTPLHLAQPDYLQSVLASARNDSERKAWSDGDWAIPPSGYFADLWAEYSRYIVIPPFDPPKKWFRWAAYDHGSSAPFGYLIFTMSNGEDFSMPDGSVRSSMKGDVYVVAEIYGAHRPNVGLKLPIVEIAKRIRTLENSRGFKIRERIADTQIFDQDNDRPSIANDFMRCGINFEPASKGPNSIKLGLSLIHDMFMNTRPGGRDQAGLFICSNCPDLIRTISNCQRSEADPDQLDYADDHLIDTLRYGLRRKGPLLIYNGRIDGRRAA